MSELNKEEIQEMLDNQSEIYADCLGTVEDDLAEKIEQLLDAKLKKIEDNICYRVYKGLRVQVGKLRDDK